MRWLALIALCAGINPAFAMLVYMPKNFRASTADVVAVIHGCLQSAEAMALGTRFNRMADERNWLVIYPQVPKGNPIDCWSWYLPENQAPDSGELNLVYDQIEQARSRFRVRGHAFLAGISSGGATVAGLIACFPQAFTAAAIHSAPGYGLASTAEESKAVLEHGPSFAKPNQAPCSPSRYNGRVMVMHGMGDRVVHPAHAENIVEMTLKGRPVVIEKTVGTSKGLRYDHFKYFEGSVRVADLIKIDVLGHAWSGSHPTNLPYFDTRGPDATQMFADFFVSAKRPIRAVRGVP